ncbi:hypothetical protein AB0F13_07195 [Streptomyces sp. NPDC026206]|uniref:hypothetical protein n=1 Tax=Streptomyces sp. NPDC026206 TaxID=3157089 RepID=UPI0033F00C89
MGGGSRTVTLLGLAVSAALIAPWSARAEEPEPTAPAPSVPVTATTSTTVFPSSPPTPGAGQLAGTVAGEGRKHPGRATESPPGAPPRSRPHASSGAAPEEAEAVEGAEPGAPAVRTPQPPAYAPGRAARAPARRADPADRVMRVLPLGTGMALTGLGLGFIALRLRRR